MKLIILALSLLSLSACAPITLSGSIESATREYFTAWRDLPSIAEPVEVQLNLTIRVIPDQHTRAAGWAWTDGKNQRIEVIGRWYRGQIVPDLMGLGHELIHQINWKQPLVGDPDKYDK